MTAASASIANAPDTDHDNRMNKTTTEKTPEQLAHLRERQARNAKAWRERHPARYKKSRQAQDAKRGPRDKKPRAPRAPKAEASQIGHPKKIPAERPAAVALRERFLDWREQQKGRK